jgi:hypothetical protein
MPEGRLARTRRAYQPKLPVDWTDPACAVCGSQECDHVLTERGHPFAWRRPSENAAEQLARRAAGLIDPGFGFTANVIEGDGDPLASYTD